MPESLARLAALGAALAKRGLGVQIPLTASAFDEWADVAGRPRLRDLWSEGRGGLLVGSGGTAFFSLFQERRLDAGSDPLDRFTAEEVAGACASALPPHGFRLIFPFVGAEPALPFQSLAEKAGAPPPGPLGLMILREWGPWWAFRALIILPFAVPPKASLSDLCSSCSAPCVSSCPAGAVDRGGFRVGNCAEHRKHEAECRDACRARAACPVAGEQTYAREQTTFHMRALDRLMQSASAHS